MPHALFFFFFFFFFFVCVWGGGGIKSNNKNGIRNLTNLAMTWELLAREKDRKYWGKPLHKCLSNLQFKEELIYISHCLTVANKYRVTKPAFLLCASKRKKQTLQLSWVREREREYSYTYSLTAWLQHLSPYTCTQFYHPTSENSKVQNSTTRLILMAPIFFQGALCPQQLRSKTIRPAMTESPVPPSCSWSLLGSVSNSIIHSFSLKGEESPMCIRYVMNI